MILRAQQLGTLDVVGMERHLAEHLPRFAPVPMGSLPAECLMAFVRLARQRAAAVGWTSRGPVEFFAELMVMLGRDFLTDPQYPWAASLLNSSTDEMEAADRLHAAFMDYYDAALGPGLEYEIEGIKRLLASPWMCERQSFEASDSAMLSMLEKLFPEKFNLVGEPAVHALLHRSIQVCSSYALPASRLSLVTAILFCFGHGAFTDPRHLWIAEAIDTPDPGKEEGLRLALETHLKGTLLGLEQ